MQKNTDHRLREGNRHIIYRMRKAGNTQQQIAESIITALKGLCVHTITYDNGLEFAGHQQVSQALGAGGYFCQPYHSWEKGGIENFNGLVRQYFLKGTNFLSVSEASLADTETELNQRPRKSLNYQSPDNLKHKLAI